MKTLILMIGLITFPISKSIAANGDNKKGKEVDSTEVATEKIQEDEFSVEISDGALIITANGEFDEYASISLATNRGSDIYFEFLKDGNNSITFDIRKVDVGSYYVVLNANDEVRLKRIQLK